ncbi:MAG: peroxidase-related enzyme [Pyrinomonadaceae bacterium]|nr:peroxidase-related enzyme [Sphingobacteriaceae bacterium]
MAHIDLKNDFPGIRGLMAFDPEAADTLNGFANVLLCRESSLSKGERELIATFVSFQNDCLFCQSVHGAVSSYHLGDTDGLLVQQVKNDFTKAAVSAKMKALLSIAGSVQKSGKSVSSLQIEEAKKEGASDQEIHDTVLIAAAFCMFNRYVDGLNTWAPTDQNIYQERAPGISMNGYFGPLRT